MSGRKTHEQQIRTLERKPDLHEAEHHREPQSSVRASEFPVSRAGMNQESRHSKHNRPGQSGHKGQAPRSTR